MPTTTTLEPLYPESLCIQFFIIDDLGAEFEEGINGLYKLPNINSLNFSPAWFRKDQAIEDYRFDVVFDGNKWVFRMSLWVNGVADDISTAILRDQAGNELNDKEVIPFEAWGSVKRANGDVIRVNILENCDNVEDNPVIDESIENNFIEQSLLDNTRILNALPRPMSGDGVEVVSLTGNHIGISFEPKNNLTGNLITFDMFGSVFRIDAAYNESQFVINESRTPRNNSSTVFTFLSAVDYPTKVFRSSEIMDRERVRLKLYGYC